ncbi:MAG: PqqD family peptide modification chaperone [Pseudomonadota bacterium]
MQATRITPDSTVCQSRNQVSTEIDGETVLLSIDKGNYYGMNKVLTAIWTWLEQPMKVSDICRKVTEIYEVSDEVCEKDVLKALGDLLNEGLIVVQ